MALANLPMFPNVIPAQRIPRRPPSPRRCRSTTWSRPRSTPRPTAVRPDRRPGRSRTGFALRTASSAGARRVGASSAPPGPSPRGKPIVAFGGNPNMPMTISFEVDDYLPAGVEREICVPIVLPKGKKDEGIAACRVEMTVGNETKEIWLRRSFDPRPAAAERSSPSATGLRARLRRRPQAAGLRAQARRLRRRLRPGHRAGDEVREPGPADRQGRRGSRTSRTPSR